MHWPTIRYMCKYVIRYRLMTTPGAGQFLKMVSTSCFSVISEIKVIFLFDRWDHAKTISANQNLKLVV